MSYLKSTTSLKEEVLTICGELTDGTSPYDEVAVHYLNDTYQAIISGGSEFGIDIAEPWVWAQSKRPINLSLEPAYSGIATLTNGLATGSFSVAPSISLQGRFLRINNRSDVYRIANHAAGHTDFFLDQEYLDNSGALSFMAFKLDYKLNDDLIIIDSKNNKLPFRETTSSTIVATIPSGAYLPSNLCSEIKVQMESAGSNTYDVSFDEISRYFTISQSGGTYFALDFSNEQYAFNSISSTIGFDVTFYQNLFSYTSSYSLSAILRLSKPIAMYREFSSYSSSSPKDVGKIFQVDDNSFLREFPISRLIQDVPDRFSPVEIDPNGTWTIRVNKSVLNDPIRAEVNYIPVPRKLFDNKASFPLVPSPYNKVLVYGAAYFLMVDKSDSKADRMLNSTQAKLNAMVNDNRKGSVLVGNGIGKLIPRLGRTKSWGWYR